MDIFNRIPEIAEDTLSYRLYAPSGPADLASMTTLAAIILEFVNGLLQNHIWHKDSFELKVLEDDELGKGKWCLQGVMRVGDCVDDEWLVVWLLKEISVKWGLAARVSDSDGEFLLIEAAEFLPSWVTPSNAENRVWMFKGGLHLIPLSFMSAPPDRPKSSRKPKDFDDDDLGEGEDNESEYLSIPDALKALESNPNATLAGSSVQDAVWQRITKYPSKIPQHVHVTKAYIPADIALALSSRPSLVQKAVETFYTRDAEHLRYAHRMSRFPPTSSILTSVRLTRTAYAQLVGQKFHPPKIFGTFKEREGTKEWHRRDVGMKIACGFEMLYQETKNSSKTSGQFVKVSDETLASLKKDADYMRYTQNLVRAGYFKGELEGSKLWKELEIKAATVFLDSRRDNDSNRESFASLVNNAIKNPVEAPQLEEQPDDWLNIDASDFDAKLEATLGKSEPQDAMEVDASQGDGEDRAAQEQADKLKGLAKRVEEFVEGEGSLEGALFDDEESEGDDDEDEDSEDDDDLQVDSNIESPPDADTEARQAAMDKLVPPLDPSEYGKMPATFYAASQRTARPDESEHDAGKPEESNKSEARPLRRPVFAKESYDGVDSDDDTDDENAEADEESEEDQPQLVGDVEIDMNEEEEEFLEFSRQTLGITDDHWQEILRDRQGRGAFIPEGALNTNATPKDSGKAKAKAKGVDRIDDVEELYESSAPRPDLKSFEEVMQAMDEELAKQRAAKHLSQQMASQKSTKNPSKGKGKVTALDAISEDAPENDLEGEMDAELRQALVGDDGADGGDEEVPMDYNLIKNFLESFRSQSGLSGPVSNLAGRLQPGWTFPRDG